MNTEPQPASPVPQEAEPTAASIAMPMWLVMAMMLILFWGGAEFDKHSGWFNPSVYAPYASAAELENWQPKSNEGQMIARGQTVFHNTCELCHGPDGMGKPGQFPPLAGSEWANAEGPNRMIRIPLIGLNGPVQIKGQQWNLAMPAMGAALSDDDLAAALTYIRQAWGNKAPAVTPDLVKAIRSQVSSRTQPWTAEELLAIPEK